MDTLAETLGLAGLWVKDETKRMRLGSFKALGGAYAVAQMICDAADTTDPMTPAAQRIAKNLTFITASAGNHGLSVAAGSQAFGAQAVIYLSDTVPESFADRLRAFGARVERDGATYEDSMKAAAEAAEANGWALLSDSSWPGYSDRPHVLMEGYLVLMAEVIDALVPPPGHIFLQAGVGGLAGACAAMARQAWGEVPKIVVVEPEAAPALAGSISAGKPVVGAGPVSAMGRLDCKEPSLIALRGLARDADMFATITEDEAQAGTELCAEAGLPTTPSGAAGLAALLAARGEPEPLRLHAGSRALVIISEGPEVS